MAKATFIHEGDVISYTPATDVAAGTIVKHGFWVGVAQQAIAAGKQGSLAISGVFDFPKPSGVGVAFVAGGDVFWSAENGISYPTQLDPGDNFAGHAVAAAADADAKVRVRLQIAANSHSPQ